MSVREGKVTFLGNPLTLAGKIPEVGSKAPDFQVLDGELSPVSLVDSTGKIRVILTVPSLDTSVCDTEVRKFNKAAVGLADNVEVLVVSMDLPFAQQRWCGAAGVDRVKALSDHKDASLGLAYGVLVEELRLLCRAVFVVDEEDCLRYVELVSEIAEEPNYEAAMDAVRELAGR